MFRTHFNQRAASPLSDDQIRRFAPSVFAEQPHESRGEKYAFIPTSAVLEGLRREGFQPYQVMQTRCRDQGKRDFTKHLLRLRHPDARALTNVGDEIAEIVLLNSHDGTSSYQLMAGVFRLVCSNGMIVGDSKFDVKIRHTGKVVDDVIEGSFRVIEEMKEIDGRLSEYKAINLAKPEQLLLAHAAHKVRWDEEEHSPVQPEQLLEPRRFEDRKDDLWTTFNRVQENLLKGGVPGRTQTGRSQRTRAVQGVNENVRLNRALWTLADGLAALKEGRPVPGLTT
jgi:hypothetical protein